MPSQILLNALILMRNSFDSAKSIEACVFKLLQMPADPYKELINVLFFMRDISDLKIK